MSRYLRDTTLVSCFNNTFTYEGSDLRQFLANTDAGIPSAVCQVRVRRKLAKYEPSLRADALLPSFCVVRRLRIAEDTPHSSRLEAGQNTISICKGITEAGH